MEIGKLNKRITITTYGAPTITEIGGYSRGSGTDVETWCSAKALSQSDILNNGLELGQKSYEFIFRYEKGEDITQATELTYKSRKFRVVSIIEIGAKMFKVLANERTN